MDKRFVEVMALLVSNKHQEVKDGIVELKKALAEAEADAPLFAGEPEWQKVKAKMDETMKAFERADQILADGMAFLDEQ